jgi:hypothetical protein
MLGWEAGWLSTVVRSGASNQNGSRMSPESIFAIGSVFDKIQKAILSEMRVEVNS